MTLSVFAVACNRQPEPAELVTLSNLGDPIRGPEITPAPDGTWQTFRAPDGLAYPSTTSLAVDPDGGIWIGTARGASHYDGRRWTTYGAASGLPSDLVLDLAVDPAGVVWFGTDKGAARFDGNNWTHFSESEGLQTGYVQVVEVDRSGQVWFGITGAGDDWAFGNGTTRLDDGGTAGTEDDRWLAFPPTRQRMAGDIVSDIVDLGEAGFWFGVTPEGTGRANSGQGGLWRLRLANPAGTEDDQWVSVRAADGLPNDTVTALAQAPGGDLWIGTTAGLMRLSPAAVAAFTFGQGRRYTVVDGLPSDRILSLAAGSDGRLWAGTDAGLAVVSGEVIETITTADGLAGNSIRAIAISDNGDVWVATPSGVSVRR